jgi:hypothetical protein
MALIYAMHNCITESVPSASPLVADGKGEGGAQKVLALLDTDVYRDMRQCINCGGPEVFVEVFECEAGRVGVCLGCGEERIIPFSRAVV